MVPVLLKKTRLLDCATSNNRIIAIVCFTNKNWNMRLHMLYDCWLFWGHFECTSEPEVVRGGICLYGAIKNVLLTLGVHMYNKYWCF